jgi:hypothetical protein
MWCSTCQQDVPGLGSTSSSSNLRCGKCGGKLVGQQGDPCDRPISNSPVTRATATENAALEKLLRGAPLSDDDWALEAELRGVQRMLGSMKSHYGLATSGLPLTPHAALATCHAALPSSSPDPRSLQPPFNTPTPRTHSAAWTILSLGMAMFTCGAVLLGWSLFAQREDLWPVGMPLALMGQAGLILGLVLQLDGVWHTSRSTTAALQELDGELKNVRQATSLLSTSHSSGAQSFYLHLAEGASPHLLLADLKGQMDLLAQQMARQPK